MEANMKDRIKTELIGNPAQITIKGLTIIFGDKGVTFSYNRVHYYLKQVPFYPSKIPTQFLIQHCAVLPIENFIKENKLTEKQFCKMCHICPDTFRKIMNDEHNFGIEAISRIAKTIGVQPFEMFEEK